MQHVEYSLKKHKQLIKNMPAGELHCYKNEGHVKCFQFEGDKRKYLTKKDDVLKRKLALKKYYEAKISDYEQEKKLIEQFLQNVNKLEHRADDLLASNSKYRKLLSQVLIPNAWESEKFETNPYCTEHLIHNTFSGIKVRSKSETIIANELFTNHIPFRYECKLMLDGSACYPDFTIKNPKTNKLIYWEHMGMMDEEDYRFKALEKINRYIRNDIIPDVNLILTYETKTHPLNSSLVQKLITWHFM